jgi:hypothetical protein
MYKNAANFLMGVNGGKPPVPQSKPKPKKPPLSKRERRLEQQKEARRLAKERAKLGGWSSI